MKLKGKPRKARLVGNLLLLASLLLLQGTFLKLSDAGMAAVAVLAFALLIAAALVFLLFWCCPCCVRGLPGTLGLEFCPRCGGAIEDDP